MGLRWGIPFVLAVAALTLPPAQAQFGGMPGMPGGPGMPGTPGGPGFGAQRPAPPAECQQLLTLRDETEKRGKALQAAGKRKAGPDVACKLFKAYLAAEMKMIKALERNGSRCGVPADMPKQLRGQHAKAETAAKNICEVAAQGPRPTGPTLSEALGTTPTVPNSTTTKRGMGTFDTLSGSPLAR
jgi:hypothetical protein